MENVYEDLTVNQQQAQFQAQQNQQSQANILDALRSGGQFNAGNIQALANQAQTATQRASASIGQQEAENKRMAAQGGMRIQSMEREGRLQQQRGDAMKQQMEFDREATMLGMSMQQVGNAQQAIAANKAMWGNIIGAGGSAAVMGSDRRLKKNIKLIGKSKIGINIYSFEFKPGIYADKYTGVWQGVMADEVEHIDGAVFNHRGSKWVDYGMLDVEFKTIKS